MRFHFKLLFSPLKWLGCFLFVCTIPITMYVPTYYDFVNVSTIYLPFIGIVLFSDIPILDKGSGAEEISYLSNRKPVRIFLQKFLIALGTLLVYIIVANVIFRVLQYFQGDMMIEPISFLEYIIIAACGSIFIGALSMTISAVLGNVYIGYGFSTIYWVYWNVNCDTEAVINPFPFIANPTFYEWPLVLIYSFSIILILLTCFLTTKSPFYLSDKVRKLLL